MKLKFEQGGTQQFLSFLPLVLSNQKHQLIGEV